MFWYYRMREKYRHLQPDNDADLRGYNSHIKAAIQREGYKKGSLVQWIQDRGHLVLKAMSTFDDDALTLEIGCGLGRHLTHISERSKRKYIAIDIEHILLKQASNKHTSVSFLLCDANQLPFKKTSFDRIVSTYVLEHIDKIDAVLQEITRVLKPSGELLLALPTEGGMAWDLGRRFVVKPAFEKKYKINYDKVIIWEHRHSIKELLATIKIFFDITSLKYIPFYIPSHHINLILAIRAQIKQKNEKR